MTQDEMIELAKQAGFKMENSAAIQAAEIFAKLIAAKVLAQRTWVGLADEDWKEIEDMPDTFDQGVAWAQAKLKQKNGYAKERTWVGLTDDEISALSKGHIVRSTYARAIEAKLKERNT